MIGILLREKYLFESNLNNIIKSGLTGIVDVENYYSS
uniref:Uncharacterized protein n=1 Tax=viral metagenome TaxID=1070528 RepID=A0A6C0EI39_9ZZZZ